MTVRGVIFLIPDQESRLPVSSTGDLIMVGNPNEFGRYSRAIVTGKVLDGSTDEPLFGAVIFEPETGRGATTNPNGEFTIEIPAGEIRLRISYLGYEERFQPLRVFGPGSINLQLFASSTQLDEVTIMARRAGENLESSRMGVVYLDAKAIKELPVSFGEKDIVRSITLLPGVQTVGEFGSGFIVRGSSTDQNLILIENVPLFNPSHMFGLISLINPDLLSSASLIKSGTPARFGERAASVLDIKLGNGLNTKEGKLKGGIGVINSRLLLEVPIVKERASFAIGGRFSNPNLFLRKMPAEDLYNSSAGFYDLNGLVQISSGQKDLITLFGYYSADQFSFMGETNYAYASTLGSLRWNRIFGPKVSTSLVLGLSNYVFETSEVPELNPTVHFRLNSGVNYQTAKWSLNYLPNQQHNIEFGLSAVKYEIDPGQLNPLGRVSVIKEDQMAAEQAREFAAHLSDDFSISERISMEIGLRFNLYQYMGPATVYLYQDGMPRIFENITDSVYYDSNSIIKSYSALEPRIGFRFSTGAYSSVKFSYTRINQYIFLISNTSLMGPADLWKLSDTYLEPLRNDQFALGYYKNFRENTIEFSVEAYYKLINNAFEYKSGSEIAMNRYIETALVKVDGYNYGLEFLLSKPAGRLSGWASYTYSLSRVRSDGPFPESQINKNQYFPTNFDRPHNLVINTNLNLSRRWRFGATFNYNTGRPVTLPELNYYYEGNYLLYFSDRNKYRLPDYHRLDVSISLNENLRLTGRGKSSFTFSVMNVYGRKNPHSVFYKKDPGGMWGVPTFKLYQMYIIARPIPTFTLNFTL
ncbi:MAG: TonB-dependent receptor [Bacteroidales bacterium]|nr:TonB-dependent receptor [Bacteroidales bacterium]